MGKVNLAIGERPVLDWVDVNLIDVDHNYQRAIKPRLVEKILSNFRWDHFGAVVLARKADGRFHVTDGQHRAKAAALHPDVEQVPAMIMSVSGMEAEAENFLAINRDRQSVSPIERYWAGISAGDAACVRIGKVLAEAGCDVVPEPGAVGPNLTAAVAALQRAVARYGDKATRQALLTIRQAWPKDAKALRGTLIAALARIHRNNDELDGVRLVSVLRPLSFAEMTAHAEGFRKLSGGSAETALAKTITEIYNKGLSKNIIFYGAAA